MDRSTYTSLGARAQQHFKRKFHHGLVSSRGE